MNNQHEHCMHPHTGPIWMVIPDGHVLLKCCKCDHTETQHADHWRQKARARFLAEFRS